MPQKEPLCHLIPNDDILSIDELFRCMQDCPVSGRVPLSAWQDMLAILERSKPIAALQTDDIEISDSCI